MFKKTEETGGYQANENIPKLNFVSIAQSVVLKWFNLFR